MFCPEKGSDFSQDPVPESPPWPGELPPFLSAAVTPLELPFGSSRWHTSTASGAHYNNCCCALSVFVQRSIKKMPFPVGLWKPFLLSEPLLVVLLRSWYYSTAFSLITAVVRLKVSEWPREICNLGFALGKQVTIGTGTWKLGWAPTQRQDVAGPNGEAPGRR